MRQAKHFKEIENKLEMSNVRLDPNGTALS